MSGKPIRSSRRSFLRKAPLAASAALVACGQAQEGNAPSVQTRKKFKWKMVTTWPKDFPGLGTGANRLAQTIGDMSGGQLEVKVYGAGELVPAMGVFDGVAGGTAEMGHASAYYWKGNTQRGFSGPFGLTAQEINGWLSWRRPRTMGRALCRFRPEGFSRWQYRRANGRLV